LVVGHQEGNELPILGHEWKHLQRIDRGQECGWYEGDQNEHCFGAHPIQRPDDGEDENEVGVEDEQFADEIEYGVEGRCLWKQCFCQQKEEGVCGDDEDGDAIGVGEGRRITRL
jgi:hypothetical protein